MYISNYESKRKQNLRYLASKRQEKKEIIDPKNVYVGYNLKTKNAAAEP